MNMQRNPISVEKEIEILYELGVPEYDIYNLRIQRIKQELSKKWN